jgi:hypothetical protein
VSPVVHVFEDSGTETDDDDNYPIQTTGHPPMYRYPSNFDPMNPYPPLMPTDPNRQMDPSLYQPQLSTTGPPPVSGEPSLAHVPSPAPSESYPYFSDVYYDKDHHDSPPPSMPTANNRPNYGDGSDEEPVAIGPNSTDHMYDGGEEWSFNDTDIDHNRPPSHQPTAGLNRNRRPHDMHEREWQRRNREETLHAVSEESADRTSRRH